MRIRTIVAAVLLCASTAIGQTPTSELRGPAGIYTVMSPGPVTITHGADYVLISWGLTPIPLPPPTPGPTPGPTPPPVPPAPPEPVDPPPIALPGLRVLMVYESSDLSKMPKEQLNVLYDTGLRDYLSQTCVKDTRGQTPEWRVYDKDAILGDDEEPWKSVIKRPRAAVPWIVISNGTSGFEGPLPATVADTRTLVAKYAGGPK